MVLGLASGIVALAQSHDAWASAYEDERIKIAEVLAGRILDIQHVGSTAIAGVPAKPILDLLVAIEDFNAARACVGPMTGLGYSFRGEYGIPERHYFVKGNPRTHHVHMVEMRSKTWTETLRFRDALRNDSVLAQRYTRRKEALAREYAYDRDSYQREKSQVVEEILASAK